MRGLIQRVSTASVYANGTMRGRIGNGLVLFLAVEDGDTEQTADKLLHKVLRYRVFEDQSGRMNNSLLDCHGGLIVVSQFTLAANTRKGLRPSFTEAAHPNEGRLLYEYFAIQAAKQLPEVVTGVFGADMMVDLKNRGPATFLLSV